VIGIKTWIFKGEILGGMPAANVAEPKADKPKKQRKGRK
jgi:small subunit ribosomal protein S3